MHTPNLITTDTPSTAQLGQTQKTIETKQTGTTSKATHTKKRKDSKDSEGSFKKNKIDNAGCYKDTDTINALHQSGKIATYDFCEAQDGNESCYRTASPVKCAVKRNDVLHAVQLKKYNPSGGSLSLPWSEGLRVSVTQRAMPAGASSPGGVTHAGQVEG
ncbi:Hypothetical predicted protein [Mytilus galloprovincialis]|uniref:Uncharacterized protein n=1 Tax=Mytilus galloprovincialis TaxID=29158 RepID=A0A8B6GV14_MYTGA|nr:Hypothetical predicted protein [Mytilus galloprovincialis]